MRVFLVLALFSVVVCARPGPRQPRACVAPSTWEGITHSYDHLTNYFSRGHISYDAVGKQIRIVEITQDNKTTTHYDNLYLFNKRAHYRLDILTKKCSKLELQDTFTPIEVHANSTYLGEYIIGSLSAPGSGVIVENWSHKTSNGGLAYQTFTVHGCLPVSGMYMGENRDGDYVHYHYDYFDIKSGVVSPEVFDVPKECM